MAIVALPKIKAVSTSLAALAGAKLYVYDAGTTTARTTYQNSSFATPHAHPIVADANGDFAAVHINPTGGAYKIDLQTSAGVSVSGYPVDNIPVEDLPLDASGNATFIASLKLTGDISPAQITAQQDNYAPPSFSTASVVRVSSDAARSITGLAGGADGRVVLIFNVGSFTITLEDEHASSTAANRFALNADLSLTADTGALLYYDATSARWRAIGGAGGGSVTWTLTTDLNVAGFSLDDSNGNLLLDFTEAASAVNYAVLHNAATGAYPKLQATGSDVSVGWEFDTKGAGTHRFSVGGTKKLELFAGALAPGTTGGYNIGSAALVFGEVHSSAYEFGGFTDSTLARISAGKLGVEGNAILMKGVTETLTAGYSVTPYNAGTKSSGTYTPAESDGAFQYATNNGAHTLAPPTNNTNLVIQYTNGASAGAITTSGFTEVSGESLTTTNGDDFVCYITKINGFSTLHVRALQ